jgi:hypothetical protein
MTRRVRRGNERRLKRAATASVPRYANVSVPASALYVQFDSAASEAAEAAT